MPALPNEMRAMLIDWVAKLEGSHEATRVELDEETLNRLRSLGYVR